MDKIICVKIIRYKRRNENHTEDLQLTRIKSILFLILGIIDILRTLKGQKNSRIRGTLNLSAFADSSTDTKKTQKNLGTNLTNVHFLKPDNQNYFWTKKTLNCHIS